MTTRVRAIALPRTLQLDDYRDVDGAAGDVQAARALGTALAHTLATRRVFMLSSTAQGGGVAEMMPRLCALLTDVGVNAQWLVMETDAPSFFAATKRLHDRLHGVAADGDIDGCIYDDVSREAGEALRAWVERGDVLVVHDPQPVGAAGHLSLHVDVPLLFRCHVGVPFENDATRSAWSFLAPRLAPFRRLLFTSSRYVPEALRARAAVLHPSIDPRDHKSRDLRPRKLVGVLASAGVLGSQENPAWAAFGAKVKRLARSGWTDAPIDGLLHAPLVVQISRFDRLKGFPVVLAAFQRLVEAGPTWARSARVATDRALDEISRAQLLLAGPEPPGVSDDPDATTVLAELEQLWRRLPDELATRVHVACLPMRDRKQNALVVNALQRTADVVVQASVQEGFGLTVTEAMYKSVPLVATDVGGISLQIRAGIDGLLVPAEDPDALAQGVFRQLVDVGRAEAMGCSARRRVAENFLVTRQLRRWLEELGEATKREAAE